MTRVLVDATTLIALGTVGELDRLTTFEGTVVVPSAIVDEVTTEPARTDLARLLETEDVEAIDPIEDACVDRAKELLGDAEVTGDVRLIAAILRRLDAGHDVAVVSDDRRVRTVSRGLGAGVTGTIGVIVRAVADGLPVEEGRRLVREVDGHGLHMTGELRERAYELIEDAGADRP